MPFIANSDGDRAAMLARIGVATIDDLFSDVPEKRRFPKLDLPGPISEMEVLREIGEMAAKNVTTSNSAWFLGAGAYNHFIPALIPAIASRGEFLTAYTPYQPEVSQGTLQAIFEYQSMAGALLGMEVVNASHYDGATALAEAVLMARGTLPNRKHILLPADLHPEYKEVIRTYFSAFDVQLEEYHGAPENANVTSETACLVAAYPTFLGEIHELRAAADKTHAAGALFIVHADPIMCALLKSPGECGADIVTAEGQSLGNPMNFGGPYLGMLGTTAKLVRKIPGRLVGQALDHQGRKGYVLTLTAREQHIRREKAISNICSNQGLVMLQTCIYLATMGKIGLKTVAELCWNKSHYTASQIAKIPGFSVTSKTFFKEFVVRTPIPAEELAEKLTRRQIVPGLPLSRYSPDNTHELLVCVTEMNTRAQIEHLIMTLAEVSR